MRVLVTGARGFLGSHVCGALAGRRSFTVARTDHAGCDLADPAQARRLVSRARPQIVFHMAGTTRSIGWAGLWDAHVRATLSLLDALRAAAPGARVVVAGSSGEYGPQGSRPVRETADPRPTTFYGATKLSQTLAALSFAGRGLDVVVGRVFNAIGPGIPDRLAAGAFASQIARVERGQLREIVVGRLDTRRDLVDARDVAAAMLALAERGASGEVYNVASGVSVPTKRVLDLLVGSARRPIPVRADPARMKRADIPDLKGDPAKLRRLGWRPSVALERSLQDTLDWHRRVSA